jgi:hypothetical protein
LVVHGLLLVLLLLLLHNTGAGLASAAALA